VAVKILHYLRLYDVVSQGHCSINKWLGYRRNKSRTNWINPAFDWRDWRKSRETSG